MSGQARSAWVGGPEFPGVAAAIAAMLGEIYRLRGPGRMPRTLVLHPDDAACVPGGEKGDGTGTFGCVYGEIVLRHDERAARGSATPLAEDGRPVPYLAPDLAT